MSRATYFRTRKDKNNPYVMMDKRPIENPQLSWKAKGILAYLLSRPDDWEIWIEDLINRSTDGKDSVRAGIAELRKAGHLVYLGRERKAGQVQRAVWEVHEVPQPNVENPHQVKTQNSGKSAEIKAENPPHTNTDTNIKPSRQKFSNPFWDLQHGKTPVLTESDAARLELERAYQDIAIRLEKGLRRGEFPQTPKAQSVYRWIIKQEQAGQALEKFIEYAMRDDRARENSWVYHEDPARIKRDWLSVPDFQTSDSGLEQNNEFQFH
jgi:hypothetical protein